MKKYTLFFVILLLQTGAYARGDGSSSLQSQDLVFQENKGQIRDQNGQIREDIDFILQAPGMTLFIGKGQLHYQFMKREKLPVDTVHSKLSPQSFVRAGSAASAFISVSRLDVSLLGADKNANALKEEPQKARYNYYTGNAGSKGITGVSSYKKITYKNIYPNIDWILYTSGTSLKYDFIVRPGGKVSAIQLKYDGADILKLEKDGSLKITTPSGSLSEQAPYAYEAQSGDKVAARYILNENTAGFKTDPYKGTLVIDPGVEWATYYVSASTISSDHSGYIYVAGSTYLSNIATIGAHQDTFDGGASDAFLSKFDTLGQLQWATYYGGGNGYTILMGPRGPLSDPYIGQDNGAVATDDFGHVYLYGSTWSTNNIATPGSFQDTLNAPPPPTTPPFRNKTTGPIGCNAFLVQFDSNGVWQWGTYYGAYYSGFSSVACDKWGNVYAAGFTDSAATDAGLITPNTEQTVFGGGPSTIPISETDGLLVKFDSKGKRQWATYYGGEDADRINKVICDDTSNLYIVGTTKSTTGMATPESFQDTFSFAHVDDPLGFLAKFNGDNGRRKWGTYIDATVDDIALDAFNHLYISGGRTFGSQYIENIATPGSYMPVQNAGNGFLMQLDPEKGLRNWGTYYGSINPTSSFIYNMYVTCDLYGNVYIAGATTSYGSSTYTIATPGSHQDTLNSIVTPKPPSDAFVAQFDSAGQRKWATYYGGPETDGVTDITCDETGAIYIVGNTKSNSGIATPGSYQDTMGNSANFIVRFLPIDIALDDVVHPSNDTACTGLVALSVLVKNQGRMDKEDTLGISYSYTGPSTGSADTFFTGGLAIGKSGIFDLHSLNLSLPGAYHFTIYLHYTRDDNERNNDTLSYDLQVINAVPEADIDVYNVGTVFHFSNKNPQPNDQYQWDFGDGQTSTEATPTHEYAVTDSYLVTLIITTPCASDTATIKVAGIGTGVGINETNLENELAVYPNPADQYLYIKAGSGIILQEYTVVNILGQTLLKGNLQQKKIVDVNSLAAGSYFIRIRTNSGWVNKQFQVLKP